MARATTSSTPLTVTFSEDAKGWVCFKSFIQDSGLSLNNDYYTLKDGELWKHHDNQLRNTFYGDHMFSHVDVLFNEESATVKSFASMKYEGTQAKITKNLGDKEYYNNEGHLGWYVESGITDLQLAGEMEFKDKEGKWFSYMKGVPVKTVVDLDSKEFSFQGIDELESIIDNGDKGGGGGGGGGGTDTHVCYDGNCLDINIIGASAFQNYINIGGIPFSSLVDCQAYCSTPPPAIIYGCTDPLATNYYAAATQDDGSCIYPPPSTFVITVQDIEDNDPVVGNI